jgi:hypothetical protein
MSKARQVSHPKFGVGTVVEERMTVGGNRVYEIRFGGESESRLILASYFETPSLSKAA